MENIEIISRKIFLNIKNLTMSNEINETMIMRKVSIALIIISSLMFGIAYAQTLDNIARKAAKKYGVKASLVCAIINQESRWQQDVVSRAGAIGLMQIMPATGKNACGLSKSELYDPFKNIDCGVYYFNEQLKRFRSTKLALCAYNAGPHRIVKYKGCPPFKETRNYYRKILKNWKSGKACPTGIRMKNPDKQVLSHRKNDAELSAKGVADYQFVEGDFEPIGWWGLVCKSLDVVYDIEMGKSEPKSVGKAAKTKMQIRTWLSILNATVNDIYRDEIRLKGKNGAMSKKRIRESIINSCPKGRS